MRFVKPGRRGRAPKTCAICGRTGNFKGRRFYAKGSFQAYGICCPSCRAEFEDFKRRLRYVPDLRGNQVVSSNWLAMDPGTALAVPGEAADLEVIRDLVDRVASGLAPVTPTVARMTALTYSVFVPRQPTPCPDRTSALDTVSQWLAQALESRHRSGDAHQLGTFADGAGLLLQTMMDEHRIGQGCWLIDTASSVHSYTAYQR